jgi:RNA polymerase sigma-70 factor (ECF subfamily)
MEMVHDSLCMLHALGQSAWPEIDLDLAAFSATAERCLTAGPVDDIRAGDLYLATACAAGVGAAIAAFDKHYLAEIAAALVRRGHDAAAAADVVQAVRVRFLLGEDGRAPRIAEYDGRGSLAAWIRVAAVRIAISANRKHRRETDEIEIVAAERSPELDLLHRRFGEAFDVAFRTAFTALSPRERTLLRYQVIDRLGIDRIATIHGVHRSTAARWSAHAREALVEGVRRALQDQLGIPSEELDSLIRMIHSQLELSLRLLLTPAR